ncbi:hypothetical protein [Streptomyces sp.]|uniref:hypothetical protein n=1 Tax=Streptomyces sp. TaxID=1931 RepID=UPI002D7807DD|nr:hypothetical protein [Streptomyces sp.]HET6354175.1 hypothetical protein [Streptomyces sp.]
MIGPSGRLRGRSVCWRLRSRPFPAARGGDGEAGVDVLVVEQRVEDFPVRQGEVRGCGGGGVGGAALVRQRSCSVYGRWVRS